MWPLTFIQKQHGTAPAVLVPSCYVLLQGKSMKASGESMSAALLPSGLSWLVPSQHWEKEWVPLYIFNYALFSTLLLPKSGDA